MGKPFGERLRRRAPHAVIVWQTQAVSIRAARYEVSLGRARLDFGANHPALAAAPDEARALPAPASGGAPNARGPDTNRIEREERSRIAAATSTKNNASPGRRFTPMTISVCLVDAASRRIVSAIAVLLFTAVRIATP